MMMTTVGSLILRATQQLGAENPGHQCADQRQENYEKEDGVHGVKLFTSALHHVDVFDRD